MDFNNILIHTTFRSRYNFQFELQHSFCKNNTICGEGEDPLILIIDKYSYFVVPWNFYLCQGDISTIYNVLITISVSMLALIIEPTHNTIWELPQFCLFPIISIRFVDIIFWGPYANVLLNFIFGVFFCLLSHCAWVVLTVISCALVAYKLLAYIY